jgi:hypothetical protein
VEEGEAGEEARGSASMDGWTKPTELKIGKLNRNTASIL